MQSVVAIANPNSQNGALGRNWADIASELRREIGSFEHAMTRGPMHAAELARDALAGGADLVIAVGGDGTIHEVANGFFDEAGAPVRKESALGVLPYGTGGDFRKTLRIPKELSAACRVLKSGRHKTIDMGRLEFERNGGDRGSRMFINIASFGIGGLVDQIVNSSSKRLGGTASFLIGTARAVAQYKNKPVRIVFDGDENDFLQTRINNVAVANGRYFGGGMKIAPRARLDDGRFDVVVLGDLGVRDFLKHGYRIYMGTHRDVPKVLFRHATRIDAEALGGEEVLLDVDGEAPGRLPATFTLHPGALQVVAPA